MTSFAINDIERFIFALSSQSWPIISTVPKPPVTSYSSCRRLVYRIWTADDGNLIDDVFARNVRIGHLRIHLRQIQHIGDFEHAAKVHQRVGEGAAEGVLASLGIGLADVDAA